MEKTSAENIFKSFSVLTDYPSDLSAVREHCRRLEYAGLAEGCFALIPPDTGALQEEFTRIFDFGKDTAPYAAFHLFSDERRRAGFMAELAGKYASAGFERTQGELPDYIPILLEFISFRGERECTELTEAVSRAAECIASASSVEKSAYGLIYRSLQKFADECLKGGEDELEYIL
ncbi:MAG: molecular chaperone TorD family protein [Geovibrio sp.]|nr:molecular chaperone TorD family protein [Geovibrio sp.]